MADLSLPTNLIFLCAILLWLAYGVMRVDMPLIVANAFSAVCIGAIVVAKLLWGRAPVTAPAPARGEPPVPGGAA